MPETGKDVGIKSRNVIWTQISAEEKHYSITFPILTFIKKSLKKIRGEQQKHWPNNDGNLNKDAPTK